MECVDARPAGSDATPRRASRSTPRIVLALLVVATIVSLVMLVERWFIYFPVRHSIALPLHVGLEAEELSLRSADGVRLRGWWLRGRGERVLVVFPGNGGNVSYFLEDAKQLITVFGLDVVLVDYRGYGQSEGSPSEAGLYADGRAVYQAALDRGFAPEQVVLLGRSLGSAVALDVAVHVPTAGVVLETPFLSVPAVARVHYPLLPPFLIRTRYDNAAKIGRLRGPILIVQAERDEVVPPTQARQLFDLAPEPKQFYVVRGARHNDLFGLGDPGYAAAWRRFLNRLDDPVPWATK